MKFYTLEAGTRVRVIGNCDVPPGERQPNGGEELIFHFVEGVYTDCTDYDGYTVHPAVWTEVELVAGDTYWRKK